MKIYSVCVAIFFIVLGIVSIFMGDVEIDIRSKFFRKLLFKQIADVPGYETNPIG